MSTALLTDRYELTMLESALQSGLAGRRAVFEVFARRLPPGRRYGVAAGQGRLRTLLDAFTYGPEELAALGFLCDETREWLDGRRLGGDISAYAEGETYFPGSPVLTVESCFGEGLLLETLVLSVLNHDSAVASAAARMVTAAKGRPLIEMGSRRTSEQAAVAAARAAYVAGFATTSNLEAGRRHGIPTAGTSAHAFVLAADDEVAAFTAQVKAQGVGTTLLVDTYDTEQGIRNAVAVAGPELGAVRLDSGDLAEETSRARTLLDSLGATSTRIVVTGDLDEHAIAALAVTDADAYGVGTSVVTGSGAPSAGLVYKLVAIAGSDEPDAPLRPVAKRSTGKASIGGRKWAARVDGGERLRLTTDGFPAGARMLQGPLGKDDVEAARDRCAASLAELPEDARRLARGEPCWTAQLEEE
ncbi:MAG: nicotinate phosphoribosyltransferase [Actinobacteria bacterium]|nr:nicotinate phosphoribosyltransferase [Actinomycetota bacterium]MCA1722013.1 nicotinate phosphoribosyltransferase [Actinomycetota bacterium]